MSAEGRSWLSFIEEQRKNKAGLGKLSPDEIAELERIVDDIALMILRNRDGADFEPDLWLDEVLGDGEVLKLDDGSVWQVEDLSQLDASLWFPPVRVAVISSDDYEFNKRIVNSENGESVLAKRLA